MDGGKGRDGVKSGMADDLYIEAQWVDSRTGEFAS
jgi:hypothetical protein